MKKILVTGADGQLGFELQKIANQTDDIVFYFFNRSQWDITNKERSKEIFEEIKPDLLINTAAYTAVDKAESDRENCYAINFYAAEYLAKCCHHWNTTMIQISTDYVFHSKLRNDLISEMEVKNPMGVYAKSKSEAEDRIMSILDKSIILRTSWLYSSHGHNFVKTILRLCTSHKELNIVDDQIGSPTYAADLAQAIIAIIRKMYNGDPIYGFFHYSNEGLCSWYDFAIAIAEYIHSDIQLQAISTSEYGAPAPRPPFSGLNCSKIKATYHVNTPFWKESLSQCLKILTKKP